MSEIEKAFKGDEEAEPEVEETEEVEKEAAPKKRARKASSQNEGKEPASPLKFACRKCKFLLSGEEKKCPSCGNSEFSDEWSGIVIILDTSSELARIIGAKRAGRYAIKVR